MSNENIDALKTTARMVDIPIQAREICDEWLLLTYDIPHTKKGDRARREFLNEARYLGATQHTASVYLMPWTPEAEILALNIAKVGQACVWTSKVTDPGLARSITEKHDKDLEDVLDEINERLDRIEVHLANEHYKIAEKMRDKTLDMFKTIKEAIIRRGSAELYIFMLVLERRLGK